jgi:fermentation-respiration switch protein FrsA (DUF1100 family)
MKKKLLILVLLIIFTSLFRRLVYQVEKDVLFQPEEEWLDGFAQEVKSLGLQELYIKSKSGKKINALFQDKKSKEVFLFCHGNVGNISYNGRNIQNLEESERSYLIFDYPGYGKSEGLASEQSLFESGQAAYDFLINKKDIDPKRIIVSGQSLGASVCLHIAAKNDVKSAIAESGFISTKEVSKDMLGSFLSIFIVNIFQNQKLVKQIEEPLLFVHGASDETLKQRHSEELYEIASEPKYLVILEGLDHNQFILDPNSELNQRFETFYKTSIFPSE